MRSTFSLVWSLVIWTTVPPTANPLASATCSSGQAPEMALASSIIAKLIDLANMRLMARTALQPSVLPYPSPSGGKVASGRW